MTTAVTVLFATASVLLIVLVLAQRSTGGLSSLFGGSVAADAGGSAAAHRNLVKFTAATAVVWTLSAVVLGLLG